MTAVWTAHLALQRVAVCIAQLPNNSFAIFEARNVQVISLYCHSIRRIYVCKHGAFDIRAAVAILVNDEVHLQRTTQSSTDCKTVTTKCVYLLSAKSQAVMALRSITSCIHQFTAASREPTRCPQLQKKSYFAKALSGC